MGSFYKRAKSKLKQQLENACGETRIRYLEEAELVYDKYFLKDVVEELKEKGVCL